MAVTQQELEQFHRFAQSKLSQSQPPDSLQECLNQWRREREETECVNDLQAARAEIDAGLGISLEDASEELRNNLLWYGRGE